MPIPVLAANLLIVPLLVTLTGCSRPSLDVPAAPVTIGQATSIAVNFHDAHGVSKLTATLVQNGAQYEAWQAPAATKGANSSFSFEVGTKTTPQLHDGTAKLILEATSAGFLHKTSRWEREVTVVTQPPVLSADSDQHYLTSAWLISRR